MEKEKRKRMIKKWIAILALAIVFIIVGAIMVQYEVEGDKNKPFNLSKIVVVSTAEGVQSDGKKKWNFNVFQNNDIYIYIDKNENYKGNNNEIKKVKIENIKIVEAPEVGEIKAYMPNSKEGRNYSYDETYIINDKLEYKGAKKSNPQTLEIGAQGGSVLIDFSNTNIGKYSSDKDEEIIHDGTLIKKIGLDEEKLKFTVSFDLVIEVEHYSHRANIKLEMPYDGISEKGKTSFVKTDMSDIIFKRE